MNAVPRSESRPRAMSVASALSRTLSALKGPWQTSVNYQHGGRSINEIEFLPAVLEVQERPPSPLGRAILWFIVVFTGLALAWSVIGRVDIIATAQGKIVSIGRTKTIQPLEVGVIRAIHVANGEHVKEGDPLVDLDPTEKTADQERLTMELIRLGADRLRFQSLAAADLLTSRPPKLVFADTTPVAMQREEQDLYLSQLRQVQSNLSAQDWNVHKLESERAALEAAIVKLEQTLPLLSERVQAMDILQQQKMVPRTSFLELKQTQVEQQQELVANQARLREDEAAIAEARAKKIATCADFRADILRQLSDTAGKIEGDEKELAKAEGQVRWQHLTAPVSGTIQQLAVHTIGGVVTPAQELMAVVPESSPIEIEALVLNRDAGFVMEGLDTEVKIETFSFTRYGTVPGKVLTVSRDAVEDKKLGLVYVARIVLDRNWIDVNGRKAALSDGMEVTAEIKTGRRRLIDYFLSPVMEHMSDSVKER